MSLAHPVLYIQTTFWYRDAMYAQLHHAVAQAGCHLRYIPANSADLLSPRHDSLRSDFDNSTDL